MATSQERRQGIQDKVVAGIILAILGAMGTWVFKNVGRVPDGLRGIAVGSYLGVSTVVAFVVVLAVYRWGVRQGRRESVAPPEAPNAALVLVQPQELSTRLRLQFFGDATIPHCITSENVQNWYANLTTCRVNGNVVKQSWQVLVVFARPVSHRQPIVTHSNPERELLLEVKFQSFHSLYIVANSQIPAGVLTVVAEGALTLPTLHNAALPSSESR